jgi:hypothetical protein
MISINQDDDECYNIRLSDQGDSAKTLLLQTELEADPFNEMVDLRLDGRSRACLAAGTVVQGDSREYKEFLDQARASKSMTSILIQRAVSEIISNEVEATIAATRLVKDVIAPMEGCALSFRAYPHVLYGILADGRATIMQTLQYRDARPKKIFCIIRPEHLTPENLRMYKKLLD